MATQKEENQKIKCENCKQLTPANLTNCYYCNKVLIVLTKEIIDQKYKINEGDPPPINHEGLIGVNPDTDKIGDISPKNHFGACTRCDHIKQVYCREHVIWILKKHEDKVRELTTQCAELINQQEKLYCDIETEELDVLLHGKNGIRIRSGETPRSMEYTIEIKEDGEWKKVPNVTKVVITLDATESLPTVQLTKYILPVSKINEIVYPPADEVTVKNGMVYPKDK